MNHWEPSHDDFMERFYGATLLLIGVALLIALRVAPDSQLVQNIAAGAALGAGYVPWKNYWQQRKGRRTR